MDTQCRETRNAVGAWTRPVLVWKSTDPLHESWANPGASFAASPPLNQLAGCDGTQVFFDRTDRGATEVGRTGDADGGTEPGQGDLAGLCFKNSERTTRSAVLIRFTTTYRKIPT